MIGKIKYPELEGQIAARGILKSDIASALGCTGRSLSNKLKGRSSFTWEEVIQMNKTFFPDLSPELLMRTRI